MTKRTGATATGSVLPLESFRASFADTFSTRTVKILSAWADTPPMKSSSIASTDILRVLCDMVDPLHSPRPAEQGYTTLELKVTYHRALTDARGPVRAKGRVIAFGRHTVLPKADSSRTPVSSAQRLRPRVYCLISRQRHRGKPVGVVVRHSNRGRATSDMGHSRRWANPGASANHRGCVKTPAFNLRVKSPSRFRQSKEEFALWPRSEKGQ